MFIVNVDKLINTSCLQWNFIGSNVLKKFVSANTFFIFLFSFLIFKWNQQYFRYNYCNQFNISNKLSEMTLLVWYVSSDSNCSWMVIIVPHIHVELDHKNSVCVVFSSRLSITSFLITKSPFSIWTVPLLIGYSCSTV